MKSKAKKVNFIKHLIHVNEVFLDDKNLTPHHISLYYSLFMSWNNFNFSTPLSINRAEQMFQSKIGSINTYLKCLKELENWGYLKYEPSHNPQKGSKVYLYSFDTTDNTTDNTTDDTTDSTTDNTTPVQLMIPLIKNIKLNKKKETIKTNKTIDEQAKNKKNKEGSLLEKDCKDELQHVQDFTPKKPIHSFPSTLQEVQVYFSEKKYPPTEAEKFYNYFESNGWLVGGRTKMKNWKAAANNWILNSKKFNPVPKENHYHTNENKDYNIPL